MVVVQAGLADGDDLGVFDEFAERGAQIIGRFGGVGGVPADGGEDGGELIGELDGAGAAFEVGADGDDFFDAGGLGAFDDLREIGGVIRIIQVGVGVVKDRHGG